MRYHPRESLKSRGDVGEVVLESVEFFFFFSCFYIFPSLEVNSMGEFGMERRNFFEG